MVVQTIYTMKNYNEILKAMYVLNSTVSYTNKFGAGAGKWTSLDRFVHYNQIDHLAVKGVELQEPVGFGTYASNPYYPSTHYNESKIAAWKAALEKFQENNDLDESVKILNPEKNLWREGFEDEVFKSAVILLLSGYTLECVFTYMHGCSVITAVERIKESGVSNTKTHPVGGGLYSLEVYGDDGKVLFELLGSNGVAKEMDDLEGELKLLIEISEIELEG
jgi:hypothetical protein